VDGWASLFGGLAGVMSVKRIESKDNPLFREFLALAEKRQARRDRAQTLLDGEHLLGEAVQAGIRPRWLICRDSDAHVAAGMTGLSDVPVVLLSPTLFVKLSPVVTPTGLLAVIDVPRPKAVAERGALMLEDIQDPGNLGSLLRTAAAAGVGEVYLSRGCTEAWSPKALRGGQGGHFRLAIHEGVDLVAKAREFAGPVFAAALGSGNDLYDLDLRGQVAFAFGNEGAGLSAELLQATTPFTIPMCGAVESLNVAAAAAICLYEKVRQGRFPEGGR
jgi:RNA methyltransferase, TrmH family